MRWDNLRTDVVAGGADRQGTLQLPLAGLAQTPGMVEVKTPEFRGITFYELRARSIVNRVPGDSAMPFRWTINPYRGCSHACVYCFARNTHTYLGLDSGADFDNKIIVKVNATQLLAKELSAASWQGESIAMGTNVDPYQRAEGRYRLMRGLLGVLSEHRNPFSILTKGTLILRDIDLLTQAATRTQVRVAVSVGTTDHHLWRSSEPGTPSPVARLGVCRTLTEHGLGCSVLMAPILPFLSDSEEQLEQTVAAIARAGATSLTPLPLHLRTGAREWYFRWLAERHPRLVPRYERLYARGAYVSRGYSEQLRRRVDRLARRYGIRGHTETADSGSIQTSDGNTTTDRFVSFRNIVSSEERHNHQQQLALI